MSDDQAREVRAAEAVEHLQQAALELIAAMRVVLDLAEEAVKDPEPLVGMASHTAQGLLAALVRLGADGGVARPHAATGDESGNGGNGTGGRKGSSGVQRIRVS